MPFDQFSQRYVSLNKFFWDVSFLVSAQPFALHTAALVAGGEWSLRKCPWCWGVAFASHSAQGWPDGELLPAPSRGAVAPLQQDRISRAFLRGSNVCRQPPGWVEQYWELQVRHTGGAPKQDHARAQQRAPALALAAGCPFALDCVDRAERTARAWCDDPVRISNRPPRMSWERLLA